MDEADKEFFKSVGKSVQDLMAALANLEMAWALERSKRWLNRRWPIRRPFFEKKHEKGFYASTFPDLKEDEDLFFKFFRMDLPTFKRLLHLTKPHFGIQRRRSDGVFEEERLIITLRYLALGEEIVALAVSHRIGESTVRDIITKTCWVIVTALQLFYLSPPNEYAWRNIAHGFGNTWNLPNCIAAIDGKHISIEAPANSGSLYRNYKQFFSIVLLATCDHQYRFTCVDVGAFGSETDGGIFVRSELAGAFVNQTMNIPDDTPTLPNSAIKTPYYFVGDAAFGLTMHMMRPYPGDHIPEDRRIFNYRLSRARRCIENAFGILAARWRILNKRIGFQPEHVKMIVMACLCLHNFLMSTSGMREKYCPPSFTDQVDATGEIVQGNWRNEVPGNLYLLSDQNVQAEVPNDPVSMRETLTKYFLSPAGEVPWQKEYVNRGRNMDIAD